jgi:hypothetical protein
MSGGDGGRDDGFQPLTTRHPLLTKVEAPTLNNFGTSFFEKLMAKRELYDANLARQMPLIPAAKISPPPSRTVLKRKFWKGFVSPTLIALLISWQVSSLSNILPRTSKRVLRHFSI